MQDFRKWIPDIQLLHSVFEDSDFRSTASTEGGEPSRAPITKHWLMAHFATLLNSSFKLLFRTDLSLQNNHKETCRKLVGPF